MARVRILLVFLISALLLVARPAFAADDANAVIALACSGGAQGDALRARLAEALLAQAGVLGSELLADHTLPQSGSLGERAIVAAHHREVEGYADANSDIPRLVQRLEDYLGPRSNVKESDRKLEATAPPASRYWLFDPAQKVELRCVSPKPPKAIIAQFEEPETREAIAIREKVDELALTGDPAKKAGAAKFTLKRTKTEKDDGTIKTVTSLSVNGTLGLRISKPDAVSPVYFYASYALSRERTKPVADPTKDQSDGDVDVLETGLTVSGLILRRASDLSLTGAFQTAFVKDFAHNAERLKLRVSLTPGFGSASLGPLCDMGGYSESIVLGLRFRKRCLLQLEGEASHVLRAGTADFNEHGEFMGVGGSAAYQLAAPMGDKAEMIGSIGYRYVPVIAGRAPDISRWDASFKYRFWLDKGPGIDLGLTWAKGNEPISYEKENKLELGFGIVF